MAKRNYSELGELLRKGRIESGLTQMKIARQLGYSSAQFVSNAERGLCRLPFPAIRKLVATFELDPNEVFDALLKDQERILRQELFGKSKRAAPLKIAKRRS